jgi:cyclic pyranopterin phosphate synthase
MLDNYGRNINNMRISVTQQCNLDCFYCHHEGEAGGEGNNEHMTPREIDKIIEIAGKVGIEKLKITGGEPLLRVDIIDIVRRASKHMMEVSMTTNGVLLERYAEAMKRAGLKRVNVSFDAYDPGTFQRITNKNSYYEVKRGVIEAINAGLNPVKLNMVVLKGVNDHALQSAMEFASSVGAVLQLIEFEGSREVAQKPFFKMYHYDLGGVEEELGRVAIVVKQRDMHRRKKYIIPYNNNGSTEVEVVRGMHNSVFCRNCTRLRITSGGKLKPCLLKKDNHIDLIELVRSGANDDELITSFEKAILLKEPYWGARSEG